MPIGKTLAHSIQYGNVYYESFLTMPILGSKLYIMSGSLLNFLIHNYSREMNQHLEDKSEQRFRLFNFVLLQVATFILQKILLDDTGLAYICQTYERFSHVAMILVSSFIYLYPPYGYF